MAGLAVNTESRIVRVVLTMAGDALPGGIHELATGMARFARWYLHMLTGQWIARKIVVEVLRADVLPALSGMASDAVGAKLSLVDVVICMTAGTIDRYSRPLCIDMTLETRGLLVLTHQRERGTVVVHSGLLPGFG